MSIAAIGAIWLRLFLYPKTMKTIIYTLWGKPHKAVKVATCTSNGEYMNYIHTQQKRK